MGKHFTSKGRSIKTYKNKLRKMEKFYKLTFKHSKANYERNTAKGYKKSDKRYFFMRYPSEKSFLDKNKIKLSNKDK